MCNKLTDQRGSDFSQPDLTAHHFALFGCAGLPITLHCSVVPDCASLCIVRLRRTGHYCTIFGCAGQQNGPLTQNVLLLLTTDSVKPTHRSVLIVYFKVKFSRKVKLKKNDSFIIAQIYAINILYVYNFRI